MCLAVPGRVESVEESIAVVDVGGATVQVRTDLCPDAVAGEWVLVHAGFALEKVDEDYAKETLALLAEMDELKNLLPEDASPTIGRPAAEAGC